MYIIFDENVPIKIPEALRLLDATCNYYEIHTINELGLLGEKDIDLFPASGIQLCEYTGCGTGGGDLSGSCRIYGQTS